MSFDVADAARGKQRRGHSRGDVLGSAVLLLAAMAMSAHADPIDLVAPLTLPDQHLAASLAIEVGLVRLRAGDPVALAPSAFFGATERLTIGITHGEASVDRIAAGAGICVHGDACAHDYTGAALDARYLAHTSRHLELAAHARALLRDVDPAKPALTAGALLRVRIGRFVAVADPYLRLGLANRDLGNRAALVIPITAGIALTHDTILALHTGYDADLAVAADGFHIPIGLALAVHATHHLDAAFEAGFASLLGPQLDYKSGAALLVFRVR